MVQKTLKRIVEHRAGVAIAQHYQTLAEKIPAPLQLKIKKILRYSLSLSLEIFAGLIVLSLLALSLTYARLNKGPISLSFLVQPIETAINQKLSGLKIDIEDGILKKDEDGPGVVFRLKNIRLFNTQKNVVIAQAPSAAINLSGKALLFGRIAPGRIDLIGPKLLLYYSQKDGLTLSLPSADNPDFRRFSQISKITRSEKTSETIAEMRHTKEDPGTHSSPKVNLIAALYDAFEQARYDPEQSYYLTKFGMKDAMIIFNHEGHQSYWHVPDTSFDLEHRQKRSILVGDVNMISPEGPWLLKFRTEQSAKKKSVTLSASFENLFPPEIAEKIPAFSALKVFNMPVSGDLKVNLNNDGDLIDWNANLQILAGKIIAPWASHDNVLIDEGAIRLHQSQGSTDIKMLPSRFHWGESRASFSGEFIPQLDDKGQKNWSFHIQAEDAVLASEEFAIAADEIDHWYLRGRFEPDTAHLRIDKYRMQFAGAAIELSGDMRQAPYSPEIHLTGGLSPMSTDVFKRLWPRLLLPRTRHWVGKNILSGEMSGGVLKIDLAAGDFARARSGGALRNEALSLNMNIENLEMRYLEGMPPLHAKKALLDITGQRLAFNIPEAEIRLPSRRTVKLSKSQFVIADLRPKKRHADLVFESSSSTAAWLELLNQKPFEMLKKMKRKPKDFGGQLTSNFKLVFPIEKKLKIETVKYTGHVRIKDFKMKPRLGKIAVSGGRVDLDISKKEIEAYGKIYLNGVPARLARQTVFHRHKKQQIKIQISGVFDQSACKQLGIPVDNFVSGKIPAKISMTFAKYGKSETYIHADLTNTKLFVPGTGWSKPPGQSAHLSFHPTKAKDGRTVLKDFRVVGHDLAIEGWVALNKSSQAAVFSFPKFSLNLISRMKISGEKKDNLWTVNATGSIYDGRSFFRSLFAPKTDVKSASSKPKAPDLNFNAQIETLVGHRNTNLKKTSINLRRRNGKTVYFWAQGRINGEALITAKINIHKNGLRQLLVEANDAGGAFRLINFYSKIRGGDASLQVFLDGQGAVSKTGALWAKNFVVLGDPVVEEVFSEVSPHQTASTRHPKHKASQSQILQNFKFDRLYIPFSIGHGQFVFHNSQINGPLLGATMRGQIDFNRQRMSVGGTYVPLFGLNSVVGELPIIGELLVGRPGEGLLGITFAIQGPMNSPQVVVNPVSLVAPGIFRQIFEMTDPAPKVIPRKNTAVQ